MKSVLFPKSLNRIYIRGGGGGAEDGPQRHRQHSHTHLHSRTHTLAHSHAHTRTRTVFLWFTGTLHRRNGFYTVQAVCAIVLHLPYT